MDNGKYPNSVIHIAFSKNERNFYIPILAIVQILAIFITCKLKLGDWCYYLIPIALFICILMFIAKLNIRWIVFPLFFVLMVFLSLHWIRPTTIIADRYENITASVYGNPKITSSGKIAVTLVDVGIDGEKQDGKAYCTIDSENYTSNLFDGARIGFEGTVYLPSEKDNEYEFDFKMWLKQNKIGYGISSVENITVFNSPNNAPILSLQARVSNYCEKQFNKSLGKYSSLAMAMLLGDKNAISPNEQVAFQKAGVAHLMAVSGLHVGFLVYMVLGLLSVFKLGVRKKPFIVGVFLLFYCVITGMAASTVRAAIMAMLILTGKALGRKPEPLITMSLAVVIILLINPLQLFATGFILSFTAVLGIVALNGKLLKLFNRVVTIEASKNDSKFKIFLVRLLEEIKKLLAVSLSAQLGTLLPVITFFHTIPLYGLLFNLLLVPLAGIIVPLYAIILLISMVPIIGLPISIAIGFAVKVLSWILQKIVFISNELTYAQIYVKAPGYYIYLSYYLIIAILSGYIRGSLKKQTTTILLLVLITACAGMVNRPSLLRYHQFSVGQGDCAMIVDGKYTIAIDVGDYGSEISQRLLAEGRSLDALIITHLHEDHANGFFELLDNNIEIKNIYLPVDSQKTYMQEDSQKILDAIYNSEIPITYLSAGDKLNYDKVSIEILWPYANTTRTSINANERSLAMLINFDELKILSVADNTSLYENYFAKKCDILKVGHHGSSESTSNEFLEYTAPQMAIITCREGTYLPADDTINRLLIHEIAIYRTDETGEIIIQKEKENYTFSFYTGVIQ